MAEAAEWVRLLEQCERLSKKLGVPHIGWDDGAALYALAFSLAAERGEVVAVDAGAGVGFSSLWILAALEGAGARGRLVAIESRGTGTPSSPGSSPRSRPGVWWLKPCWAMQSSTWPGWTAWTSRSSTSRSGGTLKRSRPRRGG